MVQKWIVFILCVCWAGAVYPQQQERKKPRRFISRALLRHYFPSPRLFLVMDSVRQEGGVEEAYQNLQGPEDLPYSGKGVILGIVDAGYDLTHPAFYTSQGEYRIQRLWDQSAKSGTPPSRFGYGAEYRTENEIQLLERDVASGSHGTHVANIAAGTRTGSPYYGVAHEADLVLVSTSLKHAEVLDGVKYIADYARDSGKPCVINLSIGGRIGPHDGTSAFDRALDSIVSPGMLIVGAAGNDGNSAFHASRLFTSERDTMRLVNTSAGGICYADIWGEVGQDFQLVSTLTDVRTGEVLFQHNEWVSAIQDTAYVDSTSYGNGIVMGIFTERDSVNNRPHAAVVCFYPGKGTYLHFETRIVGGTGHEVHAWAGESSQFALVDEHTVNTYYSVMEVGGTGRSTISVGAFVSKTKTPSRETDQVLYDIHPASGKGPTLDGRVKPDVTAGGSLVVSAVSRFDGSFRALSIDTVSRGGVDYYYAPNQGTSMASPFVAGIVALWLQANPQLTVEAVRDILHHSSWKDERVEWTDLYAWGSGKVDAYAGLKYLLQHYPLPIQSADNIESELKLLVTADGPRLFFLQEAHQVRIQGYTLSGELLFSEFQAVIGAGEEIAIPASNGYSGILLLRISTSQGVYTYKTHCVR